MKSKTITALLHGPDQSGIVAKVSGWIFERGGNIIHADQHRDMEEGVFFQRVEFSFDDENKDLSVEAKALEAFASDLNMKADCKLSTCLPKVAIFVSKYDHCFNELFLGQRAGELPCEIACVISNHPDLKSDAAHYGVPFYHIPVKAATKPEAEQEQIKILREHGVELVVMARYMQILSEDFLNNLGCPVINIHHSFLPAFAGSKPYHQAFNRGVKLIGATAHYATAILDDGPIIQQDVDRVSHRHNVSDLVVKGRMLERRVLAQAVRWHLENRILVYGRKTVVFD